MAGVPQAPLESNQRRLAADTAVETEWQKPELWRRMRIAERARRVGDLEACGVAHMVCGSLASSMRALDVEYVARWARDLGVHELWERARRT